MIDTTFMSYEFMLPIPFYVRIDLPRREWNQYAGSHPSCIYSLI